MKNGKIYSAENKIVDEMAMMNFIGNIVPHTWYKTIVKENGKPHLLAIALLSDVVYWYRPTEVRDEVTGQLIGYKKKFREDLLQRNYDQFAALYGESKRAVTEAVICLEKLGILRRVFRTIELENGVRINNVLYLQLNIKELKQFTYPDEVKEESERMAESKSSTPVAKQPGRNENHKVVLSPVPPVPKKGERGHTVSALEQEMEAEVSNSTVRDHEENFPESEKDRSMPYDPVPKKWERVSQNFGTGIPEFCDTNTKITTENTKQSDSEKRKKYIKYLDNKKNLRRVQDDSHHCRKGIGRD